MIRKLFNRLFVCGKDGHIAYTMRGDWEHCMNCGAHLTPRKWRE